MLGSPFDMWMPVISLSPRSGSRRPDRPSRGSRRRRGPRRDPDRWRPSVVLAWSKTYASRARCAASAPRRPRPRRTRWLRRSQVVQPRVRLVAAVEHLEPTGGRLGDAWVNRKMRRTRRRRPVSPARSCHRSRRRRTAEVRARTEHTVLRPLERCAARLRRLFASKAGPSVGVVDRHPLGAERRAVIVEVLRPARMSSIGRRRERRSAGRPSRDLEYLHLPVVRSPVCRHEPEDEAVGLLCVGVVGPPPLVSSTIQTFPALSV